MNVERAGAPFAPAWTLTLYSPSADVFENVDVYRPEALGVRSTVVAAPDGDVTVRLILPPGCG